MALAPGFALIRRVAMRGGLLAVPLLAALLTGCVTTGSLQFWGAEKPKECTVCQIVCTWHNTIVTAPDAVNGGAPMPGLLGRMYLFDQAMSHPLQCDGALIVDLFEETAGDPVILERFQIDPVALAKLYKKDFVGPGYTLFLPMSKSRPDLSKLRVRAAFKPTAAVNALFTENKVTLADSNGVIREASSQLPNGAANSTANPGPPPGPLGMNPNVPMPRTSSAQVMSSQGK